MPFVNQKHRDTPDMNIPGDRCYIEYKKIMDIWNKQDSSWTMVDTMAMDLYPDELQRARFLAFLVFFNLYVLPYEQEKRLENGDV